MGGGGDLESRIANIEVQIADIRSREFPAVEDEGDEAQRLHELACLRWKWNALSDVYEKGRKVLDEAIMSLVDVGDGFELGSLAIRHQATNYFDKAAWQARARGVFATPEEAEAMQALDLYTAVEKAARVSESFVKSGGIRVIPKD
jgi:hypothetical protein